MEVAYVFLTQKEVKVSSIVFLFLSVLALSWAVLQTLAPIEDDMEIMLITMIPTAIMLGYNFGFSSVHFRSKKMGLFALSMLATIMSIITIVLHMPLLKGI